MPWPVAPRVTAASPVRIPARARSSGSISGDRRDQVERGPDGALGIVLVRDGVPQTAITASPMNFSTVPP